MKLNNMKLNFNPPQGLNGAGSVLKIKNSEANRPVQNELSRKNNQQGKSAKTAAKETLMNTATTNLLSMKMDDSGSSSGLFKLRH